MTDTPKTEESLEATPLRRKLIAEAFGTFTLVFAGCGAIIINHTTNGAVSHAGIAITFGLVVLAMIYAVGDVSGAHLNPAVTIAFAAAKRFPKKLLFPYISTQIISAIAACVVLYILFPTNNAYLGSTLPNASLLNPTAETYAPNGTWYQSFILETILTFILMYVILCVSTGAKEKGITAGIAIGAVVGLEAMFAGPICGASMNPARSIAPAIVSGHLTHLWLYIVATTLGALLAVPICACTQGSTCCSNTDKC